MRRDAILALLLLAGCAGRPDGYPSLEHRPIEDGNFDEPVRPAAALTPDPALDRQIADATATLSDATAAFDRALAAAEAHVRAAQGKPAGSDAWVDAQQAMATLDDGRVRLATLSTEIDTAASARAAKLEPPYPTLDALDARIGAELDRESAATDRLQAMLAPG